MKKEITGKVYDIQGFSLQDGPGIRTTVFFKGCPLRCPWCHSPESQRFEAQLSWLALKCVGVDQCGRCLGACPQNAVSPGEFTHHAATREEIRLVHIDHDLCDDCGTCTMVCRPKALYLCGADYTMEELLDRVSKDIPFYENSGGGVTLSGGEPLCQPEFVRLFLRGLKERGIHTALDTTGYAPFAVIEPLLPDVDLFLYDIKQMDSSRHESATGVPNELILENARKIAAAGGKLQIRIPIIPHFNDSESHIREVGRYCHSLAPDSVSLIQLLPYHNLGVAKYLRIENRHPVMEAPPLSDDAVRSLKQMLEDLGLPVTIH